MLSGYDVMAGSQSIPSLLATYRQSFVMLFLWELMCLVV